MISLVLWAMTVLVILGAALYVVGVYNTVVRLSRTVDQSFGNLESILKQRHDEIPKLVNACRAYMKHEAELLERLTKLRAGYDAASGAEEKVRIENQLNREMGRLRHVWEGYPDLKANAQFMQIQQRVTGLETSINDRRELFNEQVTQHNIFIAQVPARFVAGLLSHQERSLYEVPEEDKADDLKPFPLD